MAPCSAPASKLENGAARARPRRPRAARNRSTRCRRPRSRRHLVAPVRAHREVARVRFDMMISRGDRDDGTGVPAPDHCERHVEREPGATRPWLAKHVARVQSDACWSSAPGATADIRKPSSIPHGQHRVPRTSRHEMREYTYAGTGRIIWASARIATGNATRTVVSRQTAKMNQRA